MSATARALEEARRELAQLQAQAASTSVFVPPSPPRAFHPPNKSGTTWSTPHMSSQLSVDAVRAAQSASFAAVSKPTSSMLAQNESYINATDPLAPAPAPYKLSSDEELMSLTRYYSYATSAYEPALLDTYSVATSRIDSRHATPRSSRLEAKARALAEAHAELTELQELAAVSTKTRHKEESLARLRAELEYLQALSRKPQTYLIPPDDPELAMQMPSFYSWLGLAHEPRLADYYSRGHKVAAGSLAEGARSPGIERKARELSQLRNELTQLRSGHTPRSTDEFSRRSSFDLPRWEQSTVYPQ